ncbi:MAG TPA: oligopeptide:H+ symporter [Gemmatimonadaceae bacterium]|nr:oligopeptide:H+ symporter [Gemmatimonadaceae bacterium]
MTTDGQAPSRTKGFTTLFLVELWERFGYYGMTAVVVLYMVQQLGYTDDRANLTFGAFAALAYTVPAIGGWIGDKLLGSRRTTVLGAVTLALGYIGLSIPNHPGLLFPALAVVAVGGGIFKANPANMISKLYEGDSAKIDSAFTMYYMAVNLGSAMSQIATPLIAVKVGWHAAFAVCAGGLVVGILNYLVMSRYLRHVGSAPDFQPLNVARLVQVMVGMVIGIGLVTFIIQNRTVARGTVFLGFLTMLAIFWIMGRKGSERERTGLISVLILTGLGMLFFIFYQQMSTSLTLFSLRNVELNLFGYQVPAGQVQALNPIWIFILSPGLAWLYNSLGRGEGGDFHISTKFAMGFAVLALGFFIYGFSGHFAVAGKVSFWFMIIGYAFQSLGELLISGLGLAMVARYVGPSLRGFIMGVWFLATGISQYLGSYVATYASVPQNVTSPVDTLPLYTNLFMKLGIVAVIGTVIAAALIPLMKKLSVVTEGPWEEAA